MVKSIPSSYIVSKNINDIPEEAKYSFNLLKSKHSYSLRIVDLPVILSEILDLDININEHRGSQEFDSYLLDFQRNFGEGKNVDLAQLHRDILSGFHFSKREDSVFLSHDFEAILLGILLVLTNPEHEFYN